MVAATATPTQADGAMGRRRGGKSCKPLPAQESTPLASSWDTPFEHLDPLPSANLATSPSRSTSTAQWIAQQNMLAHRMRSTQSSPSRLDQDAWDSQYINANHPPTDIAKAVSLLSRLNNNDNGSDTVAHHSKSPLRPPSAHLPSGPQSRPINASLNVANGPPNGPTRRSPAEASPPVPIKIDLIPRPGRTRDSGWGPRARTNVEQVEQPVSEHVGTDATPPQQETPAITTERTVLQRGGHAEQDLLRHIAILSKSAKTQDTNTATTASPWTETQMTSYWHIVDAMKTFIGNPSGRGQQEAALQAIIKHFPVAQLGATRNGEKPVSSVLDVIYDLCEDRTSDGRKMGYSALSAIASNLEGHYFERNVDILCQLLANRCSTDEFGSLSRSVRAHLEHAPRSTLNVMLAFLANNFVEPAKAAASVRTNILKILAVDARDFFVKDYATVRRGRPAERETVDTATECKFLGWLRQTMSSCETSENLRNLFIVSQHFGDTLSMSDLDRSLCADGRRLSILRQKWVDTLVLMVLKDQDGLHPRAVECICDLLKRDLRRDAGSSEDIPLDVFTRVTGQLQTALLNRPKERGSSGSSTVAGSGSRTSPPSLDLWKTAAMQCPFGCSLPAYKTEGLFTVLSASVRALVAGSTTSLDLSKSGDGVVVVVGEGILAAISSFVPRTWPGQATGAATFRPADLVVLEPLLFTVIQILVLATHTTNQGLDHIWQNVVRSSFQSRLRFSGIVVKQTLDAASLGFRGTSHAFSDEFLSAVKRLTANLSSTLQALDELADVPVDKAAWAKSASATLDAMQKDLKWQDLLSTEKADEQWDQLELLYGRAKASKEEGVNAVQLQSGITSNELARLPKHGQQGTAEISSRNGLSVSSGIVPHLPSTGTKRPADDVAGGDAHTARRRVSTEDSVSVTKDGQTEANGQRPTNPDRSIVSPVSHSVPIARPPKATSSWDTLRQGASRDVEDDGAAFQLQPPTQASLSIRGQGSKAAMDRAHRRIKRPFRLMADTWIPANRTGRSAASDAERQRWSCNYSSGPNSSRVPDSQHGAGLAATLGAVDRGSQQTGLGNVRPRSQQSQLREWW